ncbi:MAG: MarR family transcriptional regulator [Thermoleophilia bacterium]
MALSAEISRASEPQAMGVIAREHLSLSQGKALFVLWREGAALSIGALAEAVGLSGAAAVRMVDGLEASGLVARRGDDRDRRVRLVALTDEGEAAVRRIVDARREAMERLLARLAPDEVEGLAAALEPVLARLGLPVTGTGGCA